jgi:HEAT repeat protein
MLTQKIRIVLLSFGMAVAALGAKAESKDKDNMKVPPETRQPAAVPEYHKEPINPKWQAEARAVLNDALTSPNPYVRAHAIEAMGHTLGDKATDQILQSLKDPDAVVRFTGAMAIGDTKLKSAHDALLGLVDDNDPNVRIAVRYALHRLGDKRFSHDLEKFSIDPEKGVRGNTAMVLGRMQEPSAVNILLVMERDREPTVRLQAAEALWRLGDDRGLKTLVAGSISAYPDDVVVSLMALVGPKMRAVSGHIEAALTSDFPEVCLVAARAMGQLGSDEGYGVALQGAHSKDPRQQLLAAMALGDIGRSDSQQVLADLMHQKDTGAIPPAQDIHVAAAGALLQIGNQH